MERCVAQNVVKDANARARNANVNNLILKKRDKMKQNKFLSRRFLISLVCVLFLVLFTFLIIDGYLNLNRDEKIYTAEAKDMIDQRMASLLFEMNIFPQDIGDDLLFLGELSSLNEVFDSTDEAKEDAIKSLENDFLNYIKGSVAYYQLRYIDVSGQEIVRVEFDGINYKTITKDKLQNKAHRYYFSETIKLNKRGVYLSPLDLNIENKIIENRGTEENPVYVPTIRVATPVFSDEKLKGIIIFNIYADYFLDDIRSSQRQGENVLLINKEGYYLAHPNREKEFAFMFDKEDNFYNDYPEVSKELLLDLNKRVFESDEFIFSFKYIYPIAGSSKISDKDYSWILVTVSDKIELNNTVKNLKTNYLYFLLFSGLVILIIIVLVFVLVFRGSDIKLPGEKKQ